MRILHLNTSASTGGAAIAAARLCAALRAAGMEADMLVRDADGQKAHVFPIGVEEDHTPAERLWDKMAEKAAFAGERLQIFLHNGLSFTRLFMADTASLGMDVTEHEAFRSADVIHLHWVNQGYLSLKMLRKVLRSGKPVVWTLHDMWPFTGICHYAGNCTAYHRGCGNCPLLGRHARPADLSAKVFREKAATYAEGRIAFVGCSQWMARMADLSPLTEGMSVAHIPNALDTDFFRPGDKGAARAKLALPQDRKLLLFVAQNATSAYKGADYLLEALNIAWRNKWLHGDEILVAAGKKTEALREYCPLEMKTFDYLRGDEAMRMLYRACDVLALPSMADNLPNTCAEASACALPTVAFDTGGIGQMVDDGCTGRLVAPRDTRALAQAIAKQLHHPEAEKQGEAARQRAVEHYGAAPVAKQYRELYLRLLSKGTRPENASAREQD